MISLTRTVDDPNWIQSDLVCIIGFLVYLGLHIAGF